LDTTPDHSTPAMLYLVTSLASLAASSSSTSTPVSTGTCRDLKAAYQGSSCCGGNLAAVTNYEVNLPPPPPMGMSNTNPCYNMRETTDMGGGVMLGEALANTNCTVGGIADAAVAAAEQSGTNVTAGYTGNLATSATPIATPYYMAGLCPVNVHWHLGTEHLSVGQYDSHGSGPSSGSHGRRLSASARQGFQCHHYDSHQSKFTTPYNWKHCVDMEVGQTYEVHWPHSALGVCGTPWQYQSPFYDGVFCRPGLLSSTNQQIGVQAQIFTIVNDENYYYPDLMRGMVVDGQMGTDISHYTGSTTGTSRDNNICSAYAPITWQVDRKCHQISASSFDKMCKDMMSQRDDMSSDLHAHGARELVASHLAANNHQTMPNTGSGVPTGR